ncbi:Astacin (Peptidase M12A), partial [Parelaphostrongylus tenuis]
MSELVFRKQADEIMEDIEDNGGNRRKRQAFVDENYPKTIWSNGMTYAFWNSSKPEGDRVMVVESVGCWSHIGRIGGQQLLSLGAGCEHIGIAVHEIGHALGLFHTQSRHDRDQFITLYENNIQSGWASQFVRQTENTNYNYNITYDYGTVMHYGATSSSANGQPFMIPRDVLFLPTLGSHFLSFYEKLMVNLHYKCLASYGSATSKSTSEKTSRPQPSSKKTRRTTPQSSSSTTPQPTQKPKEDCKDRIL